MRAIVCLAQVPEDGGRLRLAPDERRLDTEGISWAVSTFDRYALEAALRLREGSEGDVVAVHVGPDRAPSVLVEALAVGADAAVQVWDPALEGVDLDPSAVARLLHAAIERLRPFDVVLAGHHAVGPDHGLVPVMLAEHLGLPAVTGVVSLAPETGGLRVARESGGEQEEWRCPMPALVALHKGPNEPRHRSLKGLLAAKKKPIDRWTLMDLGVETSALAPLVRAVVVRPAPPRAATRWLEGEPAQQAQAAAAWLREVIS